MCTESKNTKYGIKNLRVLGPDLWNSLAEKIKSTTTKFVFKYFVLTWLHLNAGVNCALSNPLYTKTRPIL